MDWLEFLSFLLSPLELGDSEPVVVYGTDYLQQVSELINHTEPRLGGAQSVGGGAQSSMQVQAGTGHGGLAQPDTEQHSIKSRTFQTSKEDVCRLLP